MVFCDVKDIHDLSLAVHWLMVNDFDSFLVNAVVLVLALMMMF